MKTLLLIIVLGFAVACTPAQPPAPPTPDSRLIETRVAANIFATQTASVPSPSAVPTVTATLASTSTATSARPPTETPKPTETPTAFSTATITPLPTPTWTPSSVPSPTPTLDLAADKQTYQAIDIRELKKAPEKFRGQKFAISGEVFRISESKAGTEMQIWVNQPGGTSLDRVAVYIKYSGSLPGLYEKDDVLVYGQGAGTNEGVNAFGGIISQPLITAKYVDYGKSLPTVPPIAKNVVANLDGKWEITYIGDYRDKTVFNYFASLNKTAMGVWATAQFRIRNLQAGSDSFGAHYNMIAIGENGEIFKDDSSATINAAWQYCGCQTINKKLNPGEETVFVVSFDVSEAMTQLVIAPTVDVFSSKPIASPRFVIDNLDQIPAWKPKK